MEIVHNACDLLSSQGANDPSTPSLADFRMLSGSGRECRTIAPYRPYSAMMLLRPQVFSVLRHLARRFWNHTWTHNQPTIIIHASINFSNDDNIYSPQMAKKKKQKNTKMHETLKMRDTKTQNIKFWWSVIFMSCTFSQPTSKKLNVNLTFFSKLSLLQKLGSTERFSLVQTH